jgi:hypothetical protein
MSRPFAFRVDRTDILLALLLGGLALAVRLAGWRFQEIVSVDGTSYIRLAKMLLGGPHYLTAQPPGYPVLMLPALALLGGDGVVAARLTALVCGVALVVAFYLFARPALGRGGAAAGAVVLALTPLAIRYSLTTMSEAPYTLVALLAVLAAARERPSAAAVFGGLSFHVRPEGLVLSVALALLHGWRPRVWLRFALVFLLVGVVPAVTFNGVTSGDWTLTRKGINIVPDSPVLNESIEGRVAVADRSLGMTDRLARFGGDALRSWPGRFGAEIGHLAGAFGVPLLLAALAGLVLTVRARRSPELLAAAGLVQLLFVPFFAGVAPVPRLVVPLFPFVVFFAGVAIRAGLARGRAVGGALAALVLGGWLVAAAPDVPALTLQEDGYYPELVAAGRALAPVFDDTTLVLDRKPYTAFYGGAQYAQIPFGAYHASIQAAQNAGGDYLVVNESVAEVFRPELLPLVKDGFTALHESRLEPVYFDPSLLGRHTVVYRVLGGGESPRPDDPAVRSTRALLSRLPHDSTLHGLHGELLWLAGRQEEALIEYEAALAAGTMLAVDYKNLARLVLGLEGDAPRAADLLRRGLTLAPDRADLRELLEGIEAALDSVAASEAATDR